MTFSIVARDGDALGVAVAGTFLAVGSVVPEIRPSVGAVATQAIARSASRGEFLGALVHGICAVQEVNLETRHAPAGIEARVLDELRRTGESR